MVLHDAAALAGAVDAVMDNSVKYSPEDGVITVDVGSGVDVTVTVTDDGPGVPPDELGHLGERFWRSERTAGEPGTGLGMSIARALLQRHGGELTASTGPNRGLRVTLRVRAAVVEQTGHQGLLRW
jgi:signal transduction histidine kinase